MEIYECILSLISGVGVFILAMKLMSDSLHQIAGDKMKTLLQKIAGNRIKGVLIGAVVTAIIQSSSATTVMIIGFVNADVMTLHQAAAIIIGSNIGTTVTGLLASLESLNISLYLSLLVFLGVMLAFIKKIKKIANLLTGLGMIFVGLKMMSSACNDESIKDEFTEVLQKIDFPLLLELLGVIFTAIIQSSSAMTGIVIVMVGNGVMNIINGLFITLGSNVGTCVTALLGIIGANSNSKRTAIIHFMFNITGCIIFTPILWIFSEQIHSLLEAITEKEAMQIAYFHLFFNISTAIVVTPLINILVKIATACVKEEEAYNYEYFEPFVREKESVMGLSRTTTTEEIHVSSEHHDDNNKNDADKFLYGDEKDKNEKDIKKDKDNDNDSSDDSEEDIIKNKKEKNKEKIDDNKKEKMKNDDEMEDDE